MACPFYSSGNGTDEPCDTGFGGEYQAIPCAALIDRGKILLWCSRE